MRGETYNGRKTYDVTVAINRQNSGPADVLAPLSTVQSTILEYVSRISVPRSSYFTTHSKLCSSKSSISGLPRSQN